MQLLRRFGRFWYDFLIGDDWIAALSAVAALGLTAALTASHNPWWLLPVAVAAILAVSVHRAARGSRRAADVAPPGDA